MENGGEDEGVKGREKAVEGKGISLWKRSCRRRRMTEDGERRSRGRKRR